MPSDITTPSDVERLVRVFYARAMDDAMIGYLFTDVAQLDLESHVPQIVAFWSTILLDEQSYAGGAFAVHASLHRRSPLRAGHFARWLELWRAAVDEQFAGTNAELAKTHAARVASAFARRIAGLDVPGPPPGGGLTITIHE